MNEQKNFEKILSSALAGNSELYNELGYAYEVGYGTKNIVEAVKWYCEAIKNAMKKRQEKQKVPEVHGENDESSFIGE